MRWKIPSLVLFILLLSECGPEVKFKSPQPEGKPNLKQIPGSFIGSFESMNDSSVLQIDSSVIYVLWKPNELIPIDSLTKDLKFRVQRDTSVILENEFTVDVKVTDDLSKAYVTAREKVFAVSDSQVVRKYKNYCFLNFRTKDGFWKVQILRIKNKYLEFNDLVASKEIDAIEEFTHIVTIKDTTLNKNLEYQLNPTRKELKRILRSRSFEKNYRKVE